MKKTTILMIILSAVLFGISLSLAEDDRYEPLVLTPEEAESMEREPFLKKIRDKEMMKEGYRESVKGSRMTDEKVGSHSTEPEKSTERAYPLFRFQF